MNKTFWIGLGERLAGASTTLAVLVTLSGCASGPPVVQTEITSYNSWSSVTNKSFAFRRVGPEAGSLEIQSYEQQARAYLVAQGLTEAREPAKASLVVTVLPWVEPRNVEVQAPVDAGPFFGGWWRAPYPAFSTYSVTVYVRKLRLEIDDMTGTGPRRVYEGTVQNESNSDQMAAVVPYLLQALFTNFPGNSGTTMRVDVPQ